MTSKEIFEYAKDLTKTLGEVLDHPSFSHTSIRNWCGVESLCVYFRCSDSPSGVLLAGGFAMNDEHKAILHERNERVNLGPSRGDIAARNGCVTITY